MRNHLKKLKAWFIRLLSKKREAPIKENRSGIADSTPSTISGGPGLKCPRCTHRIQISIPILLEGSPVCCPNCNLQLNLDVNRSKGALNAIQRLDQGMGDANMMLRG